MRNALTLLVLMVLAANCAPPKRRIACVNPDPVSGACLDAQLLQDERDEVRRQREEKEKRLSELKREVQLGNTQLTEKKKEIAETDDPAVVTQLIREHDALVDTIVAYQQEAKLSLFADLGPAPLKLGEPEQIITLHLQQDKETQAHLPVLGGLDAASEVQVSYSSMQHKFPAPQDSAKNNTIAKAADTEDNTNAEAADTDTPATAYREFAEEVALPPTLRVPLQLNFILDKAIYCGAIVIDQEHPNGGEVATQLAAEEGC